MSQEVLLDKNADNVNIQPNEAMDVDDDSNNKTESNKNIARHDCNDHDGGHHGHHHHHEHDDDNDEQQDDEKIDLNEFFYEESNEISLLHHHLKSLPDFSKYSNLDRLILRQNLLISLNELKDLINLKYLDCYLNSFEKIDETLLKLKKLEWLDFSFNSIRVIENLKSLTNLKKIYLVNNKIKKMSGLNNLSSLKMLELGSNRIRVIEGIDKLINIEQLWLGKNKIRTLENLDNLINLKLLSIQSNRITQIGNGLKYNINLQELYLSHNGLQSMDEGLLFLPNLKTLDLAGNFITKIENLQNAKNLKELWMNDNKIDTFDGLNCITSNIIETIYLERNPIQSINPEKYKQQILSAFPSLTQLDALPLMSRIRANKIESQMQFNTNKQNDDQQNDDQQ